MNVSNILHETNQGNFWVTKTKKAFEVYRVGVTHSIRCAVISLSFGLNRAIAEADRRQDQLDQARAHRLATTTEKLKEK